MLIYKNTEITKRNYKQIFDEVDIDILDIIRVSLADKINIGPYIDYCLEDPFRLWQIKYCIQEELPVEIIETVPYGSILYKLRKINSYGYDLEPLIPLLNQNQSELLMSKILEWYLQDYDLSNLNLNLILDESLDTFAKGFELGYDMTVFTKKPLSKQVLVSCFALLNNNKKIGRFINENWQEDVLIKLAQLSYDQIYDKIIPYIINEITLERLELLLSLHRKGMPIKYLTALNSNNKYVCDMEYLTTVEEVLGYGLTPKEIIKTGYSTKTLQALGKKQRNAQKDTIKTKKMKGIRL